MMLPEHVQLHHSTNYQRWSQKTTLKVYMTGPLRNSSPCGGLARFAHNIFGSFNISCKYQTEMPFFKRLQLSDRKNLKIKLIISDLSSCSSCCCCWFQKHTFTVWSKWGQLYIIVVVYPRNPHLKVGPNLLSYS